MKTKNIFCVFAKIPALTIMESCREKEEDGKEEEEEEIEDNEAGQTRESRNSLAGLLRLVPGTGELTLHTKFTSVTEYEGRYTGSALRETDSSRDSCN